MPIYHFKCSDCEYEFEIVQSMKDKPKKKCPSCKKNKLEKVLYACRGHVAKTGNDMKCLGDLAKLNTDKLSLWEKESKDEEYKNSSRLGKHKLQKQKETDMFEGHPMDKLARATDKQKQKYIEKGEIPS